MCIKLMTECLCRVKIVLQQSIDISSVCVNATLAPRPVSSQPLIPSHSPTVCVFYKRLFRSQMQISDKVFPTL